MTNPSCFNEFKKNSEFCNKICRCRIECSGDAEIKRDEVEEIKHSYKTGILSLKELCSYGIKAIENRVKEQKTRKNNEDIFFI